jgi:ribosomal protein S18 acetylase RimI-like enzyme
MNIRLADKSDEQLIKKIHKESIKEIGSFNLFMSWENYLANQSPYKFYVIDGMGFMRYGYSKMLKCYTIKEIGVLKEHRGKGVANALVKYAKKPLYLTCNTDNHSGNAFYEKIGMMHKGSKASKNGKFRMNIWVM